MPAHRPDVFDQRDEDATVELLTDTPPDGREQAVRHAAAGCPASAITVVEDGAAAHR